MTPIPPIPTADDVIKVGGAALSWDGHNVFGSTTSIELVKRYMHEAGTVPYLRERIAKLTAEVKLIAEYEGKTLFRADMDTRLPYTEGANAAFNELAGIARAAIKEGQNES